MVPSSSYYANPEDPQEEAELFGLPSPDFLTQMPDTSRAESEAETLESQRYDDLQEEAEEAAGANLPSLARILEQLSQVPESQRSDLLTSIQELFDRLDDSSNSQE